VIILLHVIQLTGCRAKLTGFRMVEGSYKLQNKRPSLTKTILWPNKKKLCFQFVSQKNIGRGFFNLFFLLLIVVYYIEVEYVYL